MRQPGHPLRRAAIVLAAGFLATCPAAVLAQGLDLGLEKLREGKKVLDAVRPMTVEEELLLGQSVGHRLKSNYGVLADESVQRYVTLVGMAVARHVPAREGIPYRFIVLDTDVINAFSIPGGDIYVTKGLLAAISSEAQLAGVLGHELNHSANRHAAKAVEKSQRWGAAEEASLADQPELLQSLTEAASLAVLSGFGREEERQSDGKGLDASAATGYDPMGLVEFLTILDSQPAEGAGRKRGGVFGSHPEVGSRIERLRGRIEAGKVGSGARLPDRYAGMIPFAAADRTVKAIAPGKPPAGEASEEGKKEDEAPTKGKKKFSLASLRDAGSRLAGGSPGGGSAGQDDRAAAGAVRGVDEIAHADGDVAYTDPTVEVTAEQLAAFLEEGGLR